MRDKTRDWIQAHKAVPIGGVMVLVLALITIPPKAKKFLAGPLVQYETIKVRKEAVSKTVSASGKVEAENQVTLKFQTSGLLSWVGVKEGDYVKKWQAIASLDKRELEKKLLKALRDYSKQRWDFEEARQVTYKDQIVTDTIKRILEKNQFDLDKAVADVEIADLAIKLATIVTPIEGIVTKIESPIAGLNITPATAKFTIADPSVMKFVTNVDESDIGQVSLGQKAIVTLDAYPDKKFEGKVTKIAFAAVATKGGGTAFPVEISLPENTNQKFKVGMNGDVEIVVAQAGEVLTIPLEALFQRNGKKYVRIVEGRAIREVQIETGVESETKVQVTKGLSEGQTIILEEKKKRSSG